MDVIVARAMLSQGLKLPHEIALSILDFAEYWPHTSTVLDHPITVNSGRGREDQFVVSTAKHIPHVALHHKHTHTPAPVSPLWLTPAHHSCAASHSA